MIELSFKSTQEISKLTVVEPGKELNQQEELKKLTTDMVLEIMGTFDQEGLGPMKWWS